MPNLPDDVLFQLMLSGLDKNALDELRRLSQVSQAWRKIVLLPVLWARYFNFEELRTKKDVWRTEVLRRTGDSPLHVNGDWIPTVIQDFFLHEFAIPNMHRIKTLHAHIGLLTKKSAADPAWSFVYDSPAPVLEIFSLDFNMHHKRQGMPRAIRERLDGGVYFTGHNPVLRVVSAMLYTDIIINWFATAAKHLTTLMVSNHPTWVLSLIQHAPQLRRLFLMEGTRARIDTQMDPADHAPVELPFLEFLYKDLEYCEYHFVPIQQAIVIPPGASIFAKFRLDVGIEYAAKMLRGYIEKTKPTKFAIRLDRFWFCDVGLNPRKTSVDELFRDHSRRDFAIHAESESVEPKLLLADILAEGVDFSSIKEWHIRGSLRWDSTSTETYAALKDFFKTVAHSDQRFIISKHNYEQMQHWEGLPDGHLIEVVDDEPCDKDDF